LGLKDLGTDCYLSALMANFDRDRPTVSRLFPKWSLDIVLQYLCSATFVPLSQGSLAAVTYKCVFLLTLATALRIGEVNALSARPDCLRRNMDGSITLLTFPGFVAKNRIPSAGAQRVTLHPLPDCPMLCPVRVLEDYLSRTEALRSDDSSLFLSLRNPRTRSSASLLSMWVRGTVQAAYRWFQTKTSNAGRTWASPTVPETSHGTHAPSTSAGAARAHAQQGRLGRASRLTEVSAVPDFVLRPRTAQDGRAHSSPGVVEEGWSGGGVYGSSPLTSTSPDLTRPAHELRALAASLALHRGTSYPEVIRAVGWSSASTFARFYLRHLGLTDPLVQEGRSVPHPAL